MTKNTSILRITCGICALILVIFASSPLALLALSEQAVAVNESVEQSPPAQQPNKTQQPAAIILDDKTSTVTDPELPVYDRFTILERKDNHLGTELPPFEYYYKYKTVYLTFDDGPDENNTPQILDILKENHIKATFFLVGTIAEKNPHIVQRIYDEGHAIGNHSYNHNYSDLYRSPDSYTAQLYKTDDVIKGIIGVRPRISRAPGGTVGSFTKAYWERLKQDGYVDISWNISSGDAAKRNVPAEDIANNVARQMENKALWTHSIVLMHDGAGHSQTVQALPKIIKLYKDNGFEFRAVNIMTPPAW